MRIPGRCENGDPVFFLVPETAQLFICSCIQ